MLETLDPEEIGGWLDDDVVYQNTGLPDVVGRTTVEQFLAPFYSLFESLTSELLTMVSQGPRVFTERLEHYVIAEDAPIGNPGADVYIKVAGWHEVQDGLVVRWSDYWDTRGFIAASGIELPSP